MIADTKIEVVPRIEGYSGRFDDRVIKVNGETVGHVWHCSAGYIKPGRRWASLGPAGISMGHKKRQDAVDAQLLHCLPSEEQKGTSK